MLAFFFRVFDAEPISLQIHFEHLYVTLPTIIQAISLSPTLSLRSDFTLLGDVGGQRTLRPYWRNYFEQTDALVWVVDSGDRMRMQDCKQELHSLLTEDVRTMTFPPERLVYYSARISLASSRCISACIGQQTGFARFDE